MIDPGAKNLAFFWGHGQDDPVVKYDCASGPSLPIFSP